MNILFDNEKHYFKLLKIIYPNETINITKNYENENVILFTDIYLYSFGHGIHNLYYFLYNYFKDNEKNKIIIPNINKNNYYYQFINIFIRDENIILLDFNTIYKFKDIKIYKNIKRDIGTKNKYKKIDKKDFIHLDYVNNILKKNLKDKTFKKYDKVYIYRSSKNTIVESNRIFHNYDKIIKTIKNKYKDLYIFKPEEHSLEEQIYIMMNCSTLVTDWGSSTENMIWMCKNTTLICLIHPWMAYFGNNQKNSHKLYMAKYLKINFKCCYCDTYYKDKLISKDKVWRENTKESWNGKLDKNYKYIMDLNKLNKLL